eukprot:GFYU01018712.1.p1 GENE.GFYU01018712.1~~GFYU01018712.1.p1  ORF type:complete len:299 (-),score=94.56 GFYU01018712.1:434-1330(-)
MSAIQDELDAEKEKDITRQREWEKTQMFNHQLAQRKAMEKEREKLKSSQEYAGNLFDSREDPPSRCLPPDQYRESLKQQINLRNGLKAREKQLEKDYFRNQRKLLAQQVAEAKQEEVNRKKKKQNEQFSMLKEQISQRSPQVPHFFGNADDPRFDTEAGTVAEEQRRRQRAREIQRMLADQRDEQIRVKTAEKRVEAEIAKQQVEQLKRELADEEVLQRSYDQEQILKLRSMWEEQIREKEANDRTLKDDRRELCDTSLMMDEDSEMQKDPCGRCTQPLPAGLSITPAIKRAVKPLIS